jgi:hypothetical protein
MHYAGTSLGGRFRAASSFVPTYYGPTDELNLRAVSTIQSR